MKRKPTPTKKERQAIADSVRSARFDAMSPEQRKVSRDRFVGLMSQRCPQPVRIPASAVYGNRFERGGWVLRLGVAMHRFASFYRSLT